MARSNSNINVSLVVDYWLKCDNDIFINKPSIKSKLNLGDVTCFCCGDHRGNLEKAHIIPVSSGGSDDINNIHILCKSCHLRTESLTDIPVIGKELYFNFIKKHPELCLIREEIMLKLIKENYELMQYKLVGENIENDFKTKVKPILSDLKIYKNHLNYWKKEQRKFIDMLMKDKPTDIDIKYEANLIRQEIKKYEDLIKLNS